MKVSIAKQQGKGGLLEAYRHHTKKKKKRAQIRKIERVINWQIEGKITVRQAKRESEE